MVRLGLKMVYLSTTKSWVPLVFTRPKYRQLVDLFVPLKLSLFFPKIPQVIPQPTSEVLGDLVLL